MSEWQPIETAPKDGSDILAWWNGHAVISWNARQQSWESDDGMVAAKTHPTHWMPLPEPPGYTP
jgi:hypothetical protein